LIRDDAVDAIVTRLFPRAQLITPNLAEAATLLNDTMAQTIEAMERQGKALIGRGAHAVLMKGGHGTCDESIDILVTEHHIEHFKASRIATRNTHGTGCTLSSAIAAELAKGHSLSDSIRTAKAYVTAALAASEMLHIGKGSGPVHHFHSYWK